MNEVVELGSVSEITRNKKFFQKKKSGFQFTDRYFDVLIQVFFSDPVMALMDKLKPYVLKYRDVN